MGAVEFISFSRMRDLKNCQMCYKGNYIDPKPEAEAVVFDMTDTAMGTFIQLLFECVVKNKLFSKREDGTYFISQSVFDELEQDLILVAKKSIVSMYDNTITELVEEGAELKHLYWVSSTFTVSHKGKGIDYLRAKTEKIVNDSLYIFLDNFNLYNHFEWDNCETEVKIQAEYKGAKITGYIDFLFRNADGTVHIVDGKYNKNLHFAEPTQMQLYGWALGIKNFKASLLNYLRQEIKTWEFFDNNDIIKELDEFIETLENCEKTGVYKRTPFTNGSVSGYCKYCYHKDSCDEMFSQKGFSEVSPDTVDLTDFL